MVPSQVLRPQAPLRAGELQVWQIVATPERRALFLGELVEAEQHRASRMRAGLARDEFIVGRATLRQLLSGCTGVAPAELVLTPGDHGKLALAQPASVEFNVAHSRGVVLIALSLDGPVGIDLESLDAAVERSDIAAANFHPAELASLQLAALHRAELSAFFRIWSRKEAVLKADGRGLIDDLHSFSVVQQTENQPEAAEQAVQLPGPGGSARLWVRDLEVQPGFAAALATTRAGLTLCMADADMLTSPDRP